MTLVSNVTDVNDKIYAAARAEGRASDPGSSRARDDAHYRARGTHDRLELGQPIVEPLATATDG